MASKSILKLHTAGLDTDGALRRFSGSEAMYERFLKRFLSEETFGQLKGALAAGDLAGLLAAAHALKGVTGNLGLTRLYKACADTVGLIRSGENDEAVSSCREIEAAYNEVCEAILGAFGETV